MTLKSPLPETFLFCTMNKLIRFYRLLNVLSIDVALGSVCCCAWFSQLFGVTLKSPALISLGLTVWIIYTADHLLDAGKIHGPASTERHRFHQRNFKTLLVMLLVAVLAGFICVFFLRKVIFQWGIALSLMMLVYFLVQEYLRYLKEFAVALLFSCGVLLPAVSLSEQKPEISLFLVISQFMLTALINLVLFSWFDHQNDIRDKRKSFVTFTGEKRTERIIRLFFGVNGLLMILTVVIFPEMTGETLIIFCMNVLLMLLFIKRSVFEINDRFRLIGDGIFVIPVIYLLAA